MAGATRSGGFKHQKPSVRSASSSSPDDLDAGPGTPVDDEHIDVDNGARGFVTPQAETPSISRPDARLSEDIETMSLNDGDDLHQAHDLIVPSEAEPLGLHIKNAIAVINKLESLGLQRLEIPLPKCVVLGEQSTGKSSVIEAISGIKTPRSTDTCTRCPLYIHMTPTPSAPHANWQAKICIRPRYVYDGKNRSTFPGWVVNPQPRDVEFASTNNPLELEKLIARAQLAVLCPRQDPQESLRPDAFSRDPKTYLKCPFSPNIVCIYVSAPSLPSLSFYDLPGIIGQSETEDDHYQVKFIKDLVSEYVMDEDSLILVTCSLENDIHNSTAGGIARELKATGRCLGVLTKPDRLPPGSRVNKLRDILEGKVFPLNHGYFVVKNPAQDAIEKGLTHSAARNDEDMFFASNEPWSKMLKDHQGRFGTKNLQAHLSVKLTAKILDRLPVIHQEVHTRLEEVETELKQLPEPPTLNSVRTVSDIVQAFAQHIRKEMEAKHPYRQWRNTWQTLYKEFFQNLTSMRPTLMIYGKLDAGIFEASMPGKSTDDSVLIESDDEGDLDTPMTDNPETPSKKRKMEEDSSPMKFQTPRKTPSKPSGIRPPAPEVVFSTLRKKFNLDEVASHLKEASKSRIPDQLDPEVVNDIIIATIQHWGQPLKKFFDELERKLKLMIQSIFREHFGPWSDSALYKEALTIVENILTSNFAEQRGTMAKESLEDELEGPFVFNEDRFNDERNKIKQNIRQARYKARQSTYTKEMMAQTGRQWTPQDAERLKKDDKKQALLNHEPYQQEIDVIARVTGYYMYAANRFYESVSKRVESKFFKRLRVGLRDELEGGLGIYDNLDGPQNAIRLLAEPAHRLGMRRELETRKKSLLDGMGYLMKLKEDYGNNTPSSHSNENPFSDL